MKLQEQQEAIILQMKKQQYAVYRVLEYQVRTLVRSSIVEIGNEKFLLILILFSKKDFSVSISKFLEKNQIQTKVSG